MQIFGPAGKVTGTFGKRFVGEETHSAVMVNIGCTTTCRERHVALHESNKGECPNPTNASSWPDTPVVIVIVGSRIAVSLLES